MTVAYFDCFSGICGDMILGALLDLGVPEDQFRRHLDDLGLDGYEVVVSKVESHHLIATDVAITVTAPQPHRTIADIRTILKESSLDAWSKEKSLEVFSRLAKAEAAVHGIAVEKVHFHEVGAVDSILDVVGSVALIHDIGVSAVLCSPLPLGRGFVHCAHGLLPVPAPATVELLKGVPVYQTDRFQELVTPTGAALITSLASSFGVQPPMTIDRIGYGAGKTKSEYPSVLRVYLGRLEKN